MKIIKLPKRPANTHNAIVDDVYEYEISPGEWADVKNKAQLLILTSLSYNIRKKL